MNQGNTSVKYLMAVKNFNQNGPNSTKLNVIMFTISESYKMNKLPEEGNLHGLLGRLKLSQDVDDFTFATV